MSDLAMRSQELGIGRLFETVRDAVIVANAQTGRIVLWNPSATGVFGYSLAEALEMNVEDLVPAALKEQQRAGTARHRGTDRGPYVEPRAALELPAVCKGGDQIYIELTLRPIESVHDSEGEGRFVLASVSTVKIHVQNIIAKLGVSDRTQAAVRAIELGLVGTEPS